MVAPVTHLPNEIRAVLDAHKKAESAIFKDFTLTESDSESNLKVVYKIGSKQIDVTVIFKNKLIVSMERRAKLIPSDPKYAQIILALSGEQVSTKQFTDKESVAMTANFIKTFADS